MIIAPNKPSTANVIDCKFEESDYLILNNIYRCNVDSDPSITTRESALQTTVKASHSEQKTNNDVLGFLSTNKTVHFFPQDLDIYFPNLKAIWIENCGLKEITQSDLKSFPHLVNCYMPKNSIKTIDEGLFDFNPKLEFVGFGDNDIVHIDPNVFDNLSKLRYFWFNNVPCINKSIDDSRADVLAVFKEVKANCVSFEVVKKSTDSTMSAVDAKIDNLHQYTKSAIDQFELTQNTLKASQDAMAASQNQIFNSIGNLTENVKSSKDDFIATHYDMKASLSDIESTLSGHKAFQRDIKIALAKLKTSQNEMKILLDDVKVGRDCSADKKLENEIENTDKSMSLSFDEKIDGIENRMMEKLEKILEEKLRKILNEVLNA